MELNRVVVSWAGPGVVGLAVNVLHFAGDVGAPSSSAILSAYSGLASSLPSGVTITVPNSGDVIEDTTGTLVGVWTSSGGGVVTGTAAGPRAAGVGFCVGWTTGGIVDGRKLRGRTFIVPIAGGAFDTDGTFQASAMTQFGTFANALQASGPLAVWHRPTTTGGSDGNSYGVVSNHVNDKAAFLSSRRD